MSAAPGTIVIDHVADGTWVLALHGEHDALSVEQLDHEASPVWEQCTRAVIDLSAADFIDSTVMQWMLDGRARLLARGVDNLAIVEHDGCFASRVLDITGLREAFTSYPSREAALAAIGGTGAPDPGAPNPYVARVVRP